MRGDSIFNYGKIDVNVHLPGKFTDLTSLVTGYDL